jgi:hypothetical protein
MVAPNTMPSARVDWDFVITTQLKVSRYGRFGPLFYKQFLPYGIETPDQHPPQRIDQRTYEMAKRLHSGKPVKLP